MPRRSQSACIADRARISCRDMLKANSLDSQIQPIVHRGAGATAAAIRAAVATAVSTHARAPHTRRAKAVQSKTPPPPAELGTEGRRRRPEDAALLDQIVE